MDLTLERTAAKGAGIADRFRSGDEVNRDNGENGAEVKFRRERENFRKRNNAAIGKSGEIDHAHAKREDVTDNEADQDGKRTQESFRKNLREQTGEERDTTDNPVLRGTEVCGALAARERVCANRQKRKSDGCHHRGRNNVRDELEPVFSAETEQAFDDTAHDDSAHKRAHALRSADGNRNREKRKADAHHDGEPGADFPDGVELDERADARDNHAVLNKRSGDALFDPDDICKDDDGGNVAHEHGEHMLQAERDGLQKRYATVQLINVI